MAFLLLLILARLSLSSFLAGPSSPRQVVVMSAEIENTQTIKGVSACRFHACDNVITSFFFFLLRKQLILPALFMSLYIPKIMLSAFHILVEGITPTLQVMKLRFVEDGPGVLSIDSDPGITSANFVFMSVKLQCICSVFAESQVPIAWSSHSEPIFEPIFV